MSSARRSPRLRPRRRVRLRPLTSPAVALLVLGPIEAEAQAHRNPAAPDSIRRIQSVTPRSGPIGTRVSIYTENLPLQARVVLGAGSIGTGFEELGEAVQGEFGEVGAEIRVPASATWDRPLVFIMFDGNFAPTGLSDPFHVTNADGRIRRVGTVTDEGGDCLAMRDSDGYFYTLAGDLGDASPGDAVAVEGTFEATGLCRRGETIRVERISDPSRAETSP